MTALTMLFAEHGVSTTERRETKQSGLCSAHREPTDPCCTICFRTVSVPPDRVCIHLRAVTCPECDQAGEHGWTATCGTCDNSGSVLPSLPDGPIHVAEEQRRHKRGGRWFDWHTPSDSEGDEGCTSASESYETERRTLSQWVADRHELWPVVDDDTPWVTETHVYLTSSGAELCVREPVGWAGSVLLDEPWAASLQPGDAVAALYDLRRIEPPITEMVEHHDGEIATTTGESFPTFGWRRAPLSVAPGVVNRIEVP